MTTGRIQDSPLRLACFSVPIFRFRFASSEACA